MTEPYGDDALDNEGIRLFESGDLANAIITCGDWAWEVHKDRLAVRCEWFRRAFFANDSEASSSKLVLENHDPKLIDIMLRCVYGRGINIPKVANGKGIPVLSVKLYRLAKYFGNVNLKDTVKAQLRAHFDRILAISAGDANDIMNNPARELEVAEVFEAIREAYTDSPSCTILQILFSFLWTRNGGVFQMPEVQALLLELPDLGKHLMFSYISLGATTNIPRMTLRPDSCLLILEAITDRDFLRSTGNRKVKKLWRDQISCILRPTPRGPSPFEVVDGDTGDVMADLDWLTPRSHDVQRLNSQQDVDIVYVRYATTEHTTEHLYLRFETPAHAKHYVECHKKIFHFVKHEEYHSSWLENQMRNKVLDRVESEPWY